MTQVKMLVEMGRLMEERPGGCVWLAERWLWVRDRQGRMRPLVANAAQREFEQRRGRQNIVLKARQMGMTTWIAGRFFLRTITRPGTLTVLVAHTRAASEAIFGVVERMWRYLPEDLREGPLRRSRANVGQMVFPELGSEFRAWSAADENAGRGLSIQNLHCSEVARWTGDARATLAGLRAALTPEGELVLESTPHGASGVFFEEWQRSEGSCGVGSEKQVPCGDDNKKSNDNGNCKDDSERDGRQGYAKVRHGDGSDSGLVRHFLPWWMEPAYVGETVAAETLSDEECALCLRHGLSAEQVGFRRRLEREFGVLRTQEFAEDAETCFRASGACCFDVEAMERRMKDLPEAVERRRGGALLVWLPARPGKEYVVAVDPAGGEAGGDFAAVQVVERSTGVQCAELQERLRPVDVAHEAVKLAREYNGATIAVERNNHGSAVHAYLEMREGYERVYRDRGQAGWLTSTASKPEMVARMATLLSEAPERFMSRRLLGECRTFVSVAGGYAAASGAHDDLVMSMAVGQMVLAGATV